MARISGYNNDSELTGNDLLVGSSYEGLQNGSPKYITRTYKLSDLATYFGGFVNNIDLNDLINRVGDLEDGVDLISTTVTNNTSAIATASQSLTVLTSDVLAQATFQTKLSATFGTFDDEGNLISLSQAFADQVLQTTASDRYAKASFVTNLASSVGTYDEDGNLVTLSSGFVDQVISTVSTDIESISTFSTNLASSFGTYNPDGTISEFSNAFAEQVFTTTAADQFAKATYVNNLGASIGQLNPDGTLVFDINSSYSQGIKTYIENNSALASSVETLQATYATLPVTIRQPEEPEILDLFNDLIYPLGSIWVDTDDNNALYVLIEDAGAPTGYSWSPTTSEALGDLILSNSQLQTQVNILSTDVSTEAQKLDTLRSKFGYFDINTGEFIVENTAEIIADLRTYADSESTSALLTNTLNAQINTGEESLSAKVTEASEAVASISEGVKASYGLTVGAGNAISSMKLLAEDPAQPGLPSTSSIVFNTDNFKIQNGSGVDQFTINTNTGKAVFAGSLEGVDGTFTGTLQAGDVTISNNLIEVDSSGGAMRFNLNGTPYGEIKAASLALSIVANNQASLIASSSTVAVNKDLGVIIGTNHTVSLTATDNFVATANYVQIGSGSNNLVISSAGTSISGTLLSLPELPSVSSSGTFTGTDFILSSDIILKENVKEYKVKPINIQYKQYNIIGGEETRVGVIAQEIEKDHPEFVRENENGIKSVSYIDMLMAKVAELEARIKELENGGTK